MVLNAVAMKKILYLVVPLTLLFASCRKDIAGPVYIDESQWLHQERAVVVYSDFSCPYFVVEAYGGYSVLRSWGGATPYQGSVMYGNFSGYGVQTFYNRSEGYLMQADVKDYWLSYYAAMDELQWACESQYR